MNERFSIFAPRYCATDGLGVNRRLFDELAADTIDSAATLASLEDDAVIENKHLLIAEFSIPGLIPTSNKREIFTALNWRPKKRDYGLYRDWSISGIDLSDNVKTTIDLAQCEGAQLLGRDRIHFDDLFKATAKMTDPTTRHIMLECGINLDELAEVYSSQSKAK